MATQEVVLQEAEFSEWPDGNIWCPIPEQFAKTMKWGWATCPTGTERPSPLRPTHKRYYYCLGCYVCPGPNCCFVSAPTYPAKKKFNESPMGHKSKEGCPDHLNLKLEWRPCQSGGPEHRKVVNPPCRMEVVVHSKKRKNIKLKHFGVHNHPKSYGPYCPEILAVKDAGIKTGCSNGSNEQLQDESPPCDQNVEGNIDDHLGGSSKGKMVCNKEGDREIVDNSGGIDVSSSTSSGYAMNPQNVAHKNPPKSQQADNELVQEQLKGKQTNKDAPASILTTNSSNGNTKRDDGNSVADHLKDTSVETEDDTGKKRIFDSVSQEKQKSDNKNNPKRSKKKKASSTKTNVITTESPKPSRPKRKKKTEGPFSLANSNKRHEADLTRRWKYPKNSSVVEQLKSNKK